VSGVLCKLKYWYTFQLKFTPFNGVSSKYLQNYLNWFAYAGKLSGTKTTIKMWLINILASAQAYELFRLFKENAVNIRT